MALCSRRTAGVAALLVLMLFPLRCFVGIPLLLLCGPLAFASGVIFGIPLFVFVIMPLGILILAFLIPLCVAVGSAGITYCAYRAKSSPVFINNAPAAPHTSSGSLDADANLTEGWYVPGVHPTLLWLGCAFVLLPVWLAVIGMNWAMWLLTRLPGLAFLDGYWMAADPLVVKQCVADAFLACDAVEKKLGPADPTGSTQGKAYPAVTCFGVSHKSGRYFGMWYYLLKHDLVDRNTNIYGYSMASIVVALLAAAMCETTHEKRLEALAAGVGLWVAYGREFYLNLFLGLPNIIRLMGGMTNKLRAHLPDDITPLQGKLHIVLTRIYPVGKNLWVVNDFSDKEDLINALKCSCYWPWQMGWGPAEPFRGQLVIDGGFVLKSPIPNAASRATAPCMVGSVEVGDAGAIWTKNPALMFILDNLRSGFPLFRDTDIAADFALGYQQALEQHQLHIGQLAAL